MSKTTQIIIGIIVIVVIVVLIVVFGGEKREKETIKIGALLSLTGDTANYGREGRNALELAKEEINKKGGINGRMIEIIYEDSACDPKTASTGMQKLVNIDKVKFVIGAVCSGATLAAAPIAEENKIILFSPISTSPKITEAGDFVFRNCPSDALSGTKAADFIIDKGYKKAAVLSENTDYSQALRETFIKKFKDLGGEVLADEVYEPNSRDVRAQLTKIKTVNPEVLVLVPQTTATAGTLARQVKELGLTPKLLMGFELFENQEAIDAAKGAAEGIIIFVPAAPVDDPEFKEFCQNYQDKYGTEIGMTFFTPNAYDALYIITEGIKKYGENTEKVRDYIYSLDNYHGASGIYSFDKNGDVTKNYDLKVIRGNKTEIYKE